jgi:hypothetical protein
MEKSDHSIDPWKVDASFVGQNRASHFFPYFLMVNFFRIGVTGFGEFSLFTLVNLFSITEAAKNVWATLSHGETMCINCDKKWLGLHFGRAFHKLIRSPCSELLTAHFLRRFAALEISVE